MDRRGFVKTAAMAGVAIGTGSFTLPEKTHILTLSFDDGFKKSFYRIADIYEEAELHACLNVIASGHLPSFRAVDEWILPELIGNFDDWNALCQRGHEVMPHSWQHLNLTEQPVEEAKGLIVKCLDYFEENLEGFKTAEAVFNFPFNASTPELEAFALSKVLGIRTHGNAVNPVPVREGPFRLGCASYGPDNIDGWVEQQVNSFLASPGGWLVLNTHGLDGEGWGAMSSAYLRNLLKQLIKTETLEILPAGEVLKRAAG